MRESPSLKLIELLIIRGACIDYSDPYVTILPPIRKYKFDMKSVELTKENLNKYDLVLLSTDLDAYDYELIAKYSKLIIDTRNAFGKRNISSNNIFKS